jgi:hypothetical protein
MDEYTRKGRELEALENIAKELERLRVLKEHELDVRLEEASEGSGPYVPSGAGEKIMGETITMPDVLYVTVDDQGEPSRFEWGPEDGDMVSVSVFGNFWRARQSVEGKDRAIRVLALEDLQDLLRGQWRDVTHVAYAPGAHGYLKSRDSVLGMVIEGVTNQ